MKAHRSGVLDYAHPTAGFDAFRVLVFFHLSFFLSFLEEEEGVGVSRVKVCRILARLLRCISPCSVRLVLLPCQDSASSSFEKIRQAGLSMQVVPN